MPNGVKFILTIPSGIKLYFKIGIQKYTHWKNRSNKWGSKLSANVCVMVAKAAFGINLGDES